MRIQSRKEVAELFGVTERAVAYWQQEAWWQPEFRTEEGYDCDAIREARRSTPRAGTGELQEARAKIRVAREKIDLDIRQAEFRERQRKEQQQLGKLLPADVYAEFLRELLGLIRRGLEELPYKTSQEVPPRVRKYFYVDPATNDRRKHPRSPALLQRQVQRLITDIERWLRQDPAEETSQ